jgi:hypothetical protein
MSCTIAGIHPYHHGIVPKVAATTIRSATKRIVDLLKPPGRGIAVLFAAPSISLAVWLVVEGASFDRSGTSLSTSF